MIYKHVCIGLGLLLVILWGCQMPTALRQKDKQANAYIEQAQAFENQGNHGRGTGAVQTGPDGCTK
jgi:hypothetical protein